MASNWPRFSPMWWVEILEQKLDAQARVISGYERYYEGIQVNWTMQTQKYRDYFRQMLQGVSDNWMPIVVDAVGERLNVQGFRMGKDMDADKDAWKIWQYNNLDAESDKLWTTTLTTGLGAIMIWASGDSKYPIKMTPEHPSEVYVADSPAGGGTLAAIKRWRDDWTGFTRANLYLPDALYKFYKDGSRPDWAPFAQGPFITSNPLGIVPVVPFRNRSTLKPGSYASEIKDVLSTQDQINKLVMDLLIASEFGAFRQRWITGIEVPTDPATGKPKETLALALDRILTFEDPEIKLGEFGATDLAGFIGAIESRIQSLASRSRTPPHYLLGQTGTFPSGESLKATETGLISKVRRRQKEYADPLERAMRIAFKILDDPRSEILDSEVIWADPESRTEAEHVDALVKKLSIGIPPEQLWVDAGYSPTQIERFKRMLREHALTSAMGSNVQINIPQNRSQLALPSQSADSGTADANPTPA